MRREHGQLGQSVMSEGCTAHDVRARSKSVCAVDLNPFEKSFTSLSAKVRV